MDFTISLYIILLIFGNYFESFRNTWISDDSGIFRNDFHIFDFNPGISLFISFILSPRVNIFSLLILFLSLFLFSFPFSPRQMDFSYFPNSKFLLLFHQLPPTPLNALLSLSPHGRPSGQGEGHITPLFAQNSLTSILFTPPSQNLKPI